MLTVSAPAKLNMTLEVLGKRQDGYHEIRSVVQAVNLCDRLRFRLSDVTEFRCDMPGWVPEKSLVSKATDLLRETTGCPSGVIIDVEKRIPLMSGLGGDSSDAAAVLRGLSRLWKLDLPQERLLELAGQLGSDVAFFLHGGTALIEGRGEIATALPPLPDTWVVLVLPSVPRKPGKTRRAYARLEASDYTDGQITERLLAVLKTGGEFTPSLLFNVFERIAFASPSEIDGYRRQMMSAGANDVHLAGSGPALFTLVKERPAAKGLYDHLQQQGTETYLAQTLPRDTC